MPFGLQESVEVNQPLRAEIAELPDSSGELSDSTELPDSSGEVLIQAELPDSSGELPFKTELPDDFCRTIELQRFNDLDTLTRKSVDSPDNSKEISPQKMSDIQQQDDIINRVKNGNRMLNDTQEKGNFGEMVADQSMRERGYTRISNDMVTKLNDDTHRGIDGVYYNPDGHPPYIIADAKYNTAQLEQTQDGKQMSEPWIDARLDAAVGKERADDIRESILDNDVGCYVIRVGIGDNVNAPVAFEKLDATANTVSKGSEIDA